MSGDSRKNVRLLLVSMVPPRNDCGVRIVMYRHLVDRAPFEMHVVSHSDFAHDLLIHTRISLPNTLQRVRKSRLGPWLSKWLHDYENHIWPLAVDRRLQHVIDVFKPDVILTLAETGLCHMAARAARRNGIPLAGLFLDWFPIMPPHDGHSAFRGILNRRYRSLYKQCDLAICTSDGMKEVLGPHRNAHVVYPMPGRHIAFTEAYPERRGKFRLVYVGAAQNFYGRMLRTLLDSFRGRSDLELIIVGPTGDWPENEILQAQEDGSSLGFMPPEEAAKVINGADALLVVMSFEREQEIFMRTSFTTKYLDYVAFGKPVILWGPRYCTPVRVARREDGALIVDQADAESVVSAAASLAQDPERVEHYSKASNRLHAGIFHPDRLQEIFVDQIISLAGNS
jgi:glycosyltransferase involved in cell wall biosynthesis